MTAVWRCIGDLPHSDTELCRRLNECLLLVAAIDADVRGLPGIMLLGRPKCGLPWSYATLASLLVGPGSEAGFRLVELVVDYKGNDDVAPMFERSRGLRAKFPRRWYQTEGPTLDAPTGSRTRPRTSFTRNPHTSATYTWPVTMRSPPGHARCMDASALPFFP